VTTDSRAPKQVKRKKSWGARSWSFFHNRNIHQKSDNLAKTNFQYEKRQKDLEKKRKKEEKLKKKLDKNNQPEPDPDQPALDEVEQLSGEAETK